MSMRVLEAKHAGGVAGEKQRLGVIVESEIVEPGEVQAAGLVTCPTNRASPVATWRIT
jgi:hypothetical protein